MSNVAPGGHAEELDAPDFAMSTDTPGINHLCQIAGLTDKQIARLVIGDPGATRSLAAWRAGWVTPPSQVQSRIDHLIKVITPLGDTPADRRASLLYSGGGQSMFAELEAEVRHPGQVLHAPMSSWMLG